METQALINATELSAALTDVAAWSEDIHLTYAWATSKEGTASHWRSVVDRVRRAIIGIHFAQTEPYVVRELHKTGRVRVVEDTTGVFHPKLLIATKGTEARVLLGSSNFTSGGFETNTEVNVLLGGSVSETPIAKLLSFIDALWSSARVPDEEWFVSYAELFERRPRPPLPTPPPSLVIAKPEGRIVSFVDREGVSQHDEFQAWRAANPEGCFLNFASSSKARLHVSLCHHSGDTTWTPGDFQKSLTKSRKVCASDATALIAWATEEHVAIVSCDCSRGLVE